MRPPPGPNWPFTGSAKSVSCSSAPPPQGARYSCIVPVAFHCTSTVSPSADRSAGRPHGTWSRSSSEGKPRLRGDAGELRDDVLAVRLQRLLLPVGHEVDVEVVDADRLELTQLRHDLLGVAEDAEAVADLVRDELAVGGADAAVVLVVVELPRLHELGQRARDLGLEAVS